MVKSQAKTGKNLWGTLWSTSKQQVCRIDGWIMQDLSIEDRCVLSGAFMTLCGMCMAIVLLVAVGFALDEVDIEYTARALARFLRKF